MKLINIALQNDAPSKAIDEERFYQLFGVRYLSQLTFQDWTVEKWIRRQCRHVEKEGRVDFCSKWLGSFHQEALTKGREKDVTIRWIDEKIGYGIFANRPFSQWEFIGEYTGILRRRRLIYPNLNDYCFMYPSEWVSLKAHTIDSEKEGNFTRFINHSDRPNLESIALFQDGIYHVVFRAAQPIPSGAELTYHYGDVYWKRRKKLSSY